MDNNTEDVLNCKLCNKLLSPDDINWTFIESSNTVTSLGLRLMIILNVTVEEIKLSFRNCCSNCSYRVQQCFSFLMEVQASAFMMKHSLAQLAGEKKDIFLYQENQQIKLYECDKCQVAMYDMMKFVDHFEYHVLSDSFSSKNCIKSTVISFGKLHKIKNEMMECDSLKDEENGLECHEGSGGSQFCCEHCLVSFRRKKQLRAHLLGAHFEGSQREEGKPKERKASGKKSFICKFCSSVLQPKSFKVHVAECRVLFAAQGSILCHLCGKSVQHAAVKRHMYMHRETSKGLQTCPVCSKVFRTTRSLKSHMILHDESRKVVCEICGLKTHPYTLWKHVKKHKSKEKKCPLCAKGFTFNYMLAAHLKTHEAGPRQGGASAPPRTHRCPRCSQEYSYVSMLNAHMKEEHDAASPAVESEYRCRSCDKSFDDQYSLKNHLLLMHAATKAEVSELKPTMQLGAFHCTLCKRVLQSEHGLRHHIKKTHGLQDREMPPLMRRSCEKCDRSFSNKAGLTAHIKSVHLNVGYLSCDMCSKTFKRHQGLVNHRLIHLGKKPFECEVCSRSFRQRSDVVRHLQRHVRDGEVSLEKAAARNNSDSNKLRKSRILLKECSYFSVAKL